MSDTVRFGVATLSAEVDALDRAALDVVYSSGLVLSTQVLPFKGYPLALYDAGSGVYSMGVILAGSSDTVADSTPYLTWRTQRFILPTSSGAQLFGVSKKVQSSTVAGSILFRGMPLAVNANNSLILTKAVVTADEQQQVFWGTNTITLRRHGPLWYFVIAEI